mgnify:CR=1 FL=1
MGFRIPGRQDHGDPVPGASPQGVPFGSERALLPAAALAYSLLGEPGAAGAAAAAWGLALAAAGGRVPTPLVRARLGPWIPPVAAFAFCLAAFLAAEAFRDGFLDGSDLHDSLQAALTCAALLVPLGLPAAAAFLGRRGGESPIRGVAAFQVSCCAGMSLASAVAVLTGWIPPLTIGQTVWANAAGTALPGLSLGLAPEVGDPQPARPSRKHALGAVPGILIRGLLLAVLLLAVYRLGLASAGDVSRASARSRNLSFLVVSLVQAAEPLAGIRKAIRSRLGGFSVPGWGIRLGGCLAALSLSAAAFGIPAFRSLLGLEIPGRTEIARALGLAGVYAALRATLPAVFASLRASPRP